MGDSPAPSDRALESYLSDVRRQLDSLSPQERRDILMELRSHVAERTARFPFPSVAEVLNELGAADVYARQFLRDELPKAPNRPTALRGLARLASGGWMAVPVLLIVVGAYGIALSAFAVGMTKLISPDEVGVWVKEVDGRTQLVHAGFNGAYGGREILGYRLALIAFAIALAIAVVVSAFLRWLARADADVHRSA